MNDHLHPLFRDALNSFANLSIRTQAATKPAPAPRKPRYIDTFDARVAGIPCQIGVIEFDRVPADRSANNPQDYYGYTECEFDVLDRNGRPALWLERKMTDGDRFAIEDKIADRFAD